MMYIERERKRVNQHMRTPVFFTILYINIQTEKYDRCEHRTNERVLCVPSPHTLGKRMRKKEITCDTMKPMKRMFNLKMVQIV